MNFFSKLFKCFCCCIFCMGSSLFAMGFVQEDEEIAYEEEAGEFVDEEIVAADEDQEGIAQSEEEAECLLRVRSMRVSARHIEGGGVGYEKGYTTVEGFFAPSDEIFATLPFLDLRGHVFDDGKLAANAGVGVRKRLSSRLYGINAYYDYRNTNRQHYNQVAVGLETLGTRWDVRLNGYLPVGDKKSSPYHRKFNHFSGHHMHISRKYEFAMKGADAEAGVHFGKTRNFNFYTAAGPYYFSGPFGNHAWGGKARLGGSFRDYISVEISDSYDNVFKNNFQGQLTLSLPFGPKLYRKNRKRIRNSSCSRDTALAQRMVQPVDRAEIVVLNTHRKKSVAINPATGKPYVFWFVNNQSSSQGTFESPFNTLSDAQSASNPYDVIYVYPGDNTSTGMSNGIILKNNQKLWGTGINQHLETTAGKIKIPVLAQGYPHIGTGSAIAATCANNNEISGIYTTGARLAYCDGITNLLVQNNLVNGLTAAGQLVLLNNCNGQITVQNNVFQFLINTAGVGLSSTVPTHAKYLIANNTFLGGGTNSAGVTWSNALNNGLSSFNSIVVENNFFSNFLASPIGGFSPVGFTGAGSLRIADNIFTGNTVGEYIPVSPGGNLTVSVVNNRWTDLPTSYSLWVYNADRVCLTMRGNASDSSASISGLTGSYILENVGTSFTADISDDNSGSFGATNVSIGSCP